MNWCCSRTKTCVNEVINPMKIYIGQLTSTINSTFICKDQDTGESYSLDIPAVAIECKTYLDKTMLEGASTAAHQLNIRNPNSLYIVVSEWLKLTESVNLQKYFVDQIYVLRKQKNTDREFRYADTYEKNPIYSDVVEHFFNTVRDHLTSSHPKSGVFIR